MDYPLSLLVAQVLLSVNIVFLLAMARTVLNLGRIRGASVFSVVLILTAFWSFTYLMELSNDDLAMATFWFQVKHLAILALPPVLVIFSMEYLRLGKRARGWVRLLLFTPALIITPLIFTNGYHHLHYQDVAMNTSGYLPGLDFIEYGFLYYAIIVYAGIYVLATIGLFVIRMTTDSLAPKSSYLIFIVAFSIPTISGFLEPYMAIPGLPLDKPLLFITVSEVLIFWGIWSSRLFEIRPMVMGKVLESMQEGVVLIDDRSMVVDLNAKADSLLGLDRERSVAKDIRELLREHRWIMDWSGPDHGVKERIVPMDRGGRTLSLRSIRISDRNKGDIGTLLMIKDITEEERSKRMLKGYNDLLSMINKVLRHDIQNDLWTMEMNMELFRKDGDKEHCEAVGAAIVKSKGTIKRMSTLEKDFLGSGEVRTYDVREVLGKVSPGNVDVRISGEGKVLADESIYSVFENLISHAIKHVSASKLDVKAYTKGGHVTVTVEDDGTGISPGITDRLFQEGFSCGSSGGTGYGLALVRRNMERYGGSVDLKAREGRGALFVLRFKEAGPTRS